MTKTTNKELQNRIKAGIAFLNVVKPNWLKEIDLEKLDLSNGNTCIIGESFGNYEEGLNQLEINDIVAEKLGFCESTKDGDVDSSLPSLKPKYKALTAAWKKTLRPMLKKI